MLRVCHDEKEKGLDPEILGLWIFPRTSLYLIDTLGGGGVDFSPKTNRRDISNSKVFEHFRIKIVRFEIQLGITLG